MDGHNKPGHDYVVSDVMVLFQSGGGFRKAVQTRVSVVGSSANKNAVPGGVGVNALMPLTPKALDLQLSVLGGYGIGRYGAAGLPDATVGASGQPAPVPEIQVLVGLIRYHTDNFDLYTYAGTEQESKKNFTAAGKGYGYGSPLYDNTTCDIELGPSSGCTADTSGVWQVTRGGRCRWVASILTHTGRFLRASAVVRRARTSRFS